MQENEVIIVDGIPSVDYEAIISNCVRYALISMPFTINRMSIFNEKERAFNIAKGKIAEELFRFFCEKNNIHPDFESCSTPFWAVDKRDFLLRGYEWDIKNNFIYTESENFKGNYINLPALIPYRHRHDQWATRNKQIMPGSKGVVFLFTFLRNSQLVNGKRGEGFLEILLNEDQIQFLSLLYAKYKGESPAKEPFSEQWFWHEMNCRGNDKLFKTRFRPALIITGYASARQWGLFKNTGPNDRKNEWLLYTDSDWYSKTTKGSCNFLNGTLWTTITNATLPVGHLPSFLAVYPHLKENISCGRIVSCG
jgi:hypothetical protein